ncbi:MAG: cupin domain-containing protein [Anaerovoracaceae bacterium]|jgi:mannose-6-phosphate isomerase-like protein (cupin superfamily)
MEENLEKRKKQLHEINRYKDNAFPVGMYMVTREGIIPEGRGFRDLHWHEELQLTYLLSGSANVQVNGEEYHLEEDEAIFINKNMLHMISDLSEDGKYISFNFKDRMLCFFAGSRMEQEDVLPYTSQYAFPSIVFHKRAGWEGVVRSYINKLYHIFLNDGPALKRRNYRVSIILSEIWYRIINNLDEDELTSSRGSVRS